MCVWCFFFFVCFPLIFSCDILGYRGVIERLIKLGFYFRELDRFATKSRNLSWIQSPNELPFSELSVKRKKDTHSVYRRAIANGIVEVLSVYRSAVLHIEQTLLSDPIPILATVTQGLNKVASNVFCSGNWYYVCDSNVCAVCSILSLAMIRSNM